MKRAPVRENHEKKDGRRWRKETREERERERRERISETRREEQMRAGRKETASCTLMHGTVHAKSERKRGLSEKEKGKRKGKRRRRRGRRRGRRRKGRRNEERKEREKITNGKRNALSQVIRWESHL